MGLSLRRQLERHSSGPGSDRGSDRAIDGLKNHLVAIPSQQRPKRTHLKRGTTSLRSLKCCRHVGTWFTRMKWLHGELCMHGHRPNVPLAGSATTALKNFIAFCPPAKPAGMLPKQPKQWFPQQRCQALGTTRAQQRRIQHQRPSPRSAKNETRW